MEFNLDQSIQVLSRTPQTLKELLLGIDEEWTSNNEGTDTWSPYDIIGHLIHGEKTDWIPRAKIILSSEENKDFKPFDRFAQFEESEGKILEQLLNEFESLRVSNLSVLKSLNIGPTDLAKEGIHPAFGKVTLAHLLSTWVVHDLGHIHQICRVMAKQYTNEVGPWTEYLGVLK